MGIHAGYLLELHLSQLCPIHGSNVGTSIELCLPYQLCCVHTINWIDQSPLTFDTYEWHWILGGNQQATLLVWDYVCKLL
jgi:hypothetical protein